MDKTAKLFLNGRSQAVRLPTSYKFVDCDEVKLRRDPISGAVTISAVRKNWDSFLLAAGESAVPDDFMAEREDTAPQEREEL